MTASLALEVEELLSAADAKVRAVSERRWCPHKPTPAQQAFLEVDAFEAMYGGAAGGGKSDALLMAALEYVDVPHYSAILFRLTYQDLSLPGALMDRAAKWLRPTAAHWNDITKQWTFPSGAKLTFGYLQHEKDVHRYQSAEFQYVGFDELTQFSETKYTYLLSRIRRTSHGELADVPLRARSATNPGGVGHAWVARRWALNEEGEQDEAKARNPETGQLRVFVPAKLADNPHVDREEYDRALSNLDRNRQDQLRRGLWKQDVTGLVCPLGPANWSSGPPRDVDLLHILCADFGSSETKETLAFSVLAWSPEVPNEMWVRWSEKHKAMLHEEMAERYWFFDRKFGIDRFIGDEGALGKQFGRELRKRHKVPIVAAKKRDRMGWVRLLRDDARVGHLKVERRTCQPFIDEAESLMWHENGKDMVGERHCYDTVLYASREARAWASERCAEEPEPGSREALRQWEEEQVEREVRDLERANQEFWK